MKMPSWVLGEQAATTTRFRRCSAIVCFISSWESWLQVKRFCPAKTTCGSVAGVFLEPLRRPPPRRCSPRSCRRRRRCAAPRPRGRSPPGAPPAGSGCCGPPPAGSRRPGRRPPGLGHRSGDVLGPLEHAAGVDPGPRGGHRHEGRRIRRSGSGPHRRRGVRPAPGSPAAPAGRPRAPPCRRSPPGGRPSRPRSAAAANGPGPASSTLCTRAVDEAHPGLVSGPQVVLLVVLAEGADVHVEDGAVQVRPWRAPWRSSRP